MHLREGSKPVSFLRDPYTQRSLKNKEFRVRSELNSQSLKNLAKFVNWKSIWHEVTPLPAKKETFQVSLVTSTAQGGFFCCCFFLLCNFATGKDLLPLSSFHQKDNVFHSLGSVCLAQIFVCASPATPVMSCFSTAIMASGRVSGCEQLGDWEVLGNLSRKKRVDFRREICNSFCAWINTRRIFSLWQSFIQPQPPELGTQTRALCLLQTPALTRNFTSRLFQTPALMRTRCACQRAPWSTTALRHTHHPTRPAPHQRTRGGRGLA